MEHLFYLCQKYAKNWYLRTAYAMSQDYNHAPIYHGFHRRQNQFCLSEVNVKKLIL